MTTSPPSCPSTKTQVILLGTYVLQLIAEANGGKEPVNIWQYRRAGRRFGVRFRFLPSGTIQGALLRQGQRSGERGVIYVRKTRNMARLRLIILHELGEAAVRWEGVPACACDATRHEVAKHVEELCYKRS